MVETTRWHIRDTARQGTKVLVLLALCFLGIMFMSYATDTYALADIGWAAAAEHMLRNNGRIILALICTICDMLGVTIAHIYYFSYAMAIVFLFAAVLVMERMLRDVIADENLRVLVSFLVIVNPFIVEYYMFIEKLAFMLAICLAVLAAYGVSRFLAGGRPIWIGLTAVLVGLAFAIYQAAVGMFVVIAVPLAFYDALWHGTGRTLRHYVRNLLVVSLSYLVVAVLYMVFYRMILQGTRSAAASRGITTLIRQILRGEWTSLVSTYQMFPRYVYLLFLCAALVLSLVAACQTRRALLHILNLCISMGAILAVTAAPIVGGGWFSMRVIYPLASMVGVALLDTCIAVWDLCAAEDARPEERMLDGAAVTTAMDKADGAVQAGMHGEMADDAAEAGMRRGADRLAANGAATIGMSGGTILLAAGVLGGVLVLVQAVGFNRIYLNKYECNHADEMRSLLAGQMIAEYERDTGNVITRVVFYRDANPTYDQYPGLYHNGDMVVSSYCETWSDLVALNYYLDADYERGEEDPDYAALFASQDWSQYSNEQVILDGDTMHYCVY